MKYFLMIAIAVLTIFANGDLTAQVSSTPRCRAGTLDLRASSLPGISCSGGVDIARGKGAKPQSTLDIDSCNNAIDAAHNWEEDLSNYGPAYDTMKWYIRNCYQNPSGGTWSVFGGSLDSVIKTQAGRDDVYNFILTVLNLRTDDGWFCGAVPFLEVKWNDGPNGTNEDYRVARAITQFLIENPRCAFNHKNDSLEYFNLLSGQYNLWSDTANIGAVFDTTIPTLQQLGLDTLLKFAAASDVHYEVTGSQIIGSASIMPNPTLGQATVSLSIEREAYVHIEVFDLLGEKENGIDYEGVFETGQYTTPLDLRNLPAGSYYVRVTTANNEVRTLKLVKE